MLDLGKGADIELYFENKHVELTLFSIKQFNLVTYFYFYFKDMFGAAGNTYDLLLLGGGVVTTRAHVHYIVTEYGIAYLFGKNIRQRAHELIRIAHPDHREALEAAAFERLKCMPSPD